MSFVIKLLSSLLGWTVTSSQLKQVCWFKNRCVSPFGSSHRLKQVFLFLLLLLLLFCFFNYNNIIMNKGILISKNVFIEKKNQIIQENFCGGLISWNYYLNRWKKVQIWKEPSMKMPNNSSFISEPVKTTNHRKYKSIKGFMHQNEQCETQQWNQFWAGDKWKTTLKFRKIAIK